MIIKGNSIEEINHRKDYGVRGLQDQIRHFVVFTTTPDNPFRPHKHAGLEFWHILEGEAVVTLDGEDYAVEAGDLVFLAPWTEHAPERRNRRAGSAWASAACGRLPAGV